MCYSNQPTGDNEQHTYLTARLHLQALAFLSLQCAVMGVAMRHSGSLSCWQPASMAFVHVHILAAPVSVCWQ